MRERENERRGGSSDRQEKNPSKDGSYQLQSNNISPERNTSIRNDRLVCRIAVSLSKISGNAEGGRRTLNDGSEQAPSCSQERLDLFTGTYPIWASRIRETSNVKLVLTPFFTTVTAHPEGLYYAVVELDCLRLKAIASFWSHYVVKTQSNLAFLRCAAHALH